MAQIDEEGLRIHDMRHTCASMLIAAGAHPGHVREHLGHSSIRVTMDVYGHLYEDTEDEIAQRLQAIHRGLREGALPTDSSHAQRLNTMRCGVGVVLNETLIEGSSALRIAPSARP